MIIPAPLLRITWALLALVQLTVMAGGPLADALHEDVDERVTHVESEAGDDCPSQHDHLFCQLWRTLVLGGGDDPPSRLHGMPATTGAGLARTALDLPPTLTGLPAHLGSRAPPLG